MNWASPSKPWDLCSDDRKRKLRVAWSGGNLRWKLDPSQQQIYDAIYASHPTVKSAAERVFCLDVSRQSGKDFMMIAMAIGEAMRHRNGHQMIRIPYGCPTRDTVKDLLVPTVYNILQDCPPDLLPEEVQSGAFRRSANALTWQSSRIVLVGLDLHPDWLRGPASKIFFLTEAGFVPELEGTLEGVLLPQMLTLPDGWGVMASTPPDTPGHVWSQKYLPAAQARDMYAKRTIYDCPRFSPEQVEGFIKELGGPKSTRVRRELFCEHIIEESMAVVPEFQEYRVQTVEAVETFPPYRDTYVALDPGFAHATGGVFVSTDFAKGLAVVEGDFATKHLNSREVARYIKAREWQLWGREPLKPASWTDKAWEEELQLIRGLFYRDLPPVTKPVQSFYNGQIQARTLLRVSDTDSRLIADMASEHGIQISPTDKDDADAAINSLRIAIQGLKYRIHPRCTNLIAHLSQATWNRGRTKLAESADGGHFDCVPALVYFNRMCFAGRTMRNPNPPMSYSHHTHHVPPGSGVGSQTKQALLRLFGSKPRRRS